MLQSPLTLSHILHVTLLEINFGFCLLDGAKCNLRVISFSMDRCEELKKSSADSNYGQLHESASRHKDALACGRGRERRARCRHARAIIAKIADKQNQELESLNPLVELSRYEYKPQGLK
jgi:hypothetical protein